MGQHAAIVPREKLDFGLDGDIPQYWFEGDVFKSRYFDALSTIFPEGERYFISCVRDYRDQITDPKLLQDVKDFIRQEGQHGIVHSKYNDRLKRQGIDVDKLEATQHHLMFNVLRKHLPAAVTLADTAAAEHLTATMAHILFEKRDVLGKVAPRMRAMYAWHAMEEVEHKAVAFDVMQKVAKVGYLRRCFALLLVTLGFNLNALISTRYMLKCDGYTRLQRWGMFAKGLWWLYGPGGVYLSMLGPYLQYLKPGFHPWQQGELKSYRVWLDTFNRTGDPIAAGNVLQTHGA
jgi:predicted metal-dependent hydrolase